jgi:hypothetical protein
MRPTHAGRLAGAAALALLVGGLAACGGDDDGDGGDNAGGGAATTTEAAGGGGELAAYCSAEVDLETTSASVDFEGDPAGAAASILEKATVARDLAPDDVVPLFDEGIATLQSVVDGGDPAALEAFDPSRIHAFDLENCGWETSEVTATEYAFEGIPDEVPAGPHSFELTNAGNESHVMVVLTKADGVTDSWDEILAAGEDSGLYEELGAAFAPPGGEGSGVIDLAPGDYMALCPIPTGTTADAEGTGPPHFTHGMTHEFTVT